jgi:hypothetical protein
MDNINALDFSDCDSSYENTHIVSNEKVIAKIQEWGNKNIKELETEIIIAKENIDIANKFQDEKLYSISKETISRDEYVICFIKNFILKPEVKK